MRISSWSKLTKRLLRSTEAGEVMWKETDRAGAYVLAMSEGTVTVSRQLSEVEGRAAARLQLYDVDGNEAASIDTDTLHKSDDDENEFVLAANILDLYDVVVARQDQAEFLVDRMIEYLEDPPL